MAQCTLQRRESKTFLLFLSLVSCARLVRQKVFPGHGVSLWKPFSFALPLSWGLLCFEKWVWEEGLRNGRLQGAATSKKSWVIWNGQGSPAHLSFWLPWEAMAFSVFCIPRWLFRSGFTADLFFLLVFPPGVVFFFQRNFYWNLCIISPSLNKLCTTAVVKEFRFTHYLIPIWQLVVLSAPRCHPYHSAVVQSR